MNILNIRDKVKTIFRIFAPKLFKSLELYISKK